MSGHDPDAWLGRAGREVHASDPLHPFAARALAAALDHEPLPAVEAELRPLAHWLYFLKSPSAAATGGDGHASDDELLPLLPLPRRMWAGGAVSFLQPLRFGISAQRVSRLDSIQRKQGRSGGLLFINLQHEIRQSGAVCLTEMQSLVFRETPAAPGSMPPAETQLASPEWSRTLTPDPVLLFRYSALTYNSHRIHYDRDYATGVERYPGLLVQAPLIATLLVELAMAGRPCAQLKKFEFRAIRPAFEGGALRLCARNDGHDVELWSHDVEDRVGMRARAEFLDAP